MGVVKTGSNVVRGPAIQNRVPEVKAKVKKPRKPKAPKASTPKESSPSGPAPQEEAPESQELSDM